VDEAAEPVPAQNAHTGRADRWRHATCRRVLLQRPVGAVRIIVIEILAGTSPDFRRW
jgi:hypothetical protein